DLGGDDSFQDMTLAANADKTMNGAYEEDEIRHEKSKLPTDRDARTVAGVASDYLESGLHVPEGGAYDPDEGFELEVSLKPDEPEEAPQPKPKRGGRGLGQIRLEKKEVRPSFDPSEEMTEAGVGLDSNELEVE